MKTTRMKSSRTELLDSSGTRSSVAFSSSNAAASDWGLLTRISIVDEVLDGHLSVLGDDFVAYRNHVYRVANLCNAILGTHGEVDKIAAAAVFHDLGIWTGRTFDYIAPSIALAREYLVASARKDWITEIT